MYHPHADEMVQMAMGMLGFFVIHPKVPESCASTATSIFLLSLRLDPGTAGPTPWS